MRQDIVLQLARRPLAPAPGFGVRVALRGQRFNILPCICRGRGIAGMGAKVQRDMRGGRCLAMVAGRGAAGRGQGALAPPLAFGHSPPEDI